MQSPYLKHFWFRTVCSQKCINKTPKVERDEAARLVKPGRCVRATMAARPRPLRPPRRGRRKCAVCGRAGHTRADCDALIV